MLCCREISKLVSESMERPLPFRRRLKLRVHLMLCRLCAGFARQTRLLRRAAQEYPERLLGDTTTPKATLSHEACERIKAAFQDSRP